MARLTDAERRARLVARHHLGGTADGVLEAVEGVVALHSSDPLTPHLGCRARMPGFVTGDLDRALYTDRTLWRLHAMRRTLFVVPSGEAAVFFAAVGRRMAERERRRLEQWLEAERGPARAWLAAVEARVLEALADGRERRTQDLTRAVPELATELTVGSGRWVARVPLSSRLLYVLAMDGRVVRTRPAGSWRSSQYHWAAADRWFAQPLTSMDERSGRAALARRYLGAHGPATLADVSWWTGWTTRQAATALADVGPTTVELASGGEGFVLPGDDEPVPGVPAVALLPALDPTPMGWKERDWYLGPHAARLFDRNGNAGPTIWLDGRAVGGWAQRPDGEVVFRLLEDVGADAVERVAEAAAALAGWLAGDVATPRFRTPLERELSA